MKVEESKNKVLVVILIVLSAISIPVIHSAILFITGLYAYTVYIIFCYKDERLIAYFLLCCAFQNIVCIIFSRYITSIDTTLILCVKEALVYIYVGCSLIKNASKILKHTQPEYIFFFLFIVLSLASVVFTDSSIKVQVIGVRQLAIPFVCYLFGNNIFETKEKYKKLIDFIIILSAIIAFAGIIIYIIPNTMWDKIGFQTFWNNKNNTSGVVFKYANFYTYDLNKLFGRIKRLVSFTADPLASVHIITLGLILSMFYKNKSYMLKVLLLIALILGVSKGAIVILFCAVVVTIYMKMNSVIGKRIINGGVLAGGGVFFIVMREYMNSLTKNTATGNHYSAFLNGIQDMTFFGKGLGTAGYSVGATGAQISSDYTESFFAVLSAQLGFVGIVVVYGFVIFAAWKAMRLYKASKDNKHIIAAICVVSIAVESLFSSSSVSMVGSGIYFVVAGNILNLGSSNKIVDNKNKET